MIAADLPPGAAVEPFQPDRRLAEYEAMLDISVRLAGTLDLHTVLELALENAEEVCRAETSSIWELDEERQELFFRVVRGTAAGEIRGLRVPVGQGIVGSVAATGQPEVVNDVASDPRWHGDAADEFRTRAILAVPLLSHGRVIGVLQLLNPVGREAFTGEDVWRTRLFAAILSPPLQSARLYAERQRQYLYMVTALAESLEKKDTYTGGHVRRVVGYSMLLGAELEKKDTYTGGHVRRVVGYSMLLGAELGLSREEQKDLWLAATLHDIGKIGVPDHILGKPAPLDREEFAVMQRHTVFGAEIVSHLANPRILLGVRSHHERIDGRGYPDGLAGEQIPLVPRIIAVADTYDAMTTSRPYRQGLPPEKAVEEILAGAGTQFCPRVVGAFRGLAGRGRFNLAEAESLLGSLAEPV